MMNLTISGLISKNGVSSITLALYVEYVGTQMFVSVLLSTKVLSRCRVVALSRCRIVALSQRQTIVAIAQLW